VTLSAKATDALIDALNYIHEHPEEWYQGSWIQFVKDNRLIGTYVKVEEAPSCGTAACLAGRVVLQRPEFKLTSTWEFSWNKETYLSLDRVFYRGSEWLVQDAVTDFLLQGSTRPYVDKEYLGNAFYSENTEGDLWYWANKLADRELTPPEGVEIPDEPTTTLDGYDDDFDV
jgi:hypothetical protein